jgi:hypothetical protein
MMSLPSPLSLHKRFYFATMSTSASSVEIVSHVSKRRRVGGVEEDGTGASVRALATGLAQNASDNIDVEIKTRAEQMKRTLDSALAQLKWHAERELLKLPTALRKVTLAELVETYHGQEDRAISAAAIKEQGKVDDWVQATPRVSTVRAQKTAARMVSTIKRTAHKARTFQTPSSSSSSSSSQGSSRRLTRSMRRSMSTRDAEGTDHSDEFLVALPMSGSTRKRKLATARAQVGQQRKPYSGTSSSSSSSSSSPSSSASSSSSSSSSSNVQLETGKVRSAIRSMRERIADLLKTVG